MMGKNKNILMSFSGRAEEMHVAALKSRARAGARKQPSLPMSIPEFQEIVDRHFVPWMNEDEREGYEVFLSLMRGKSFSDVAKDRNGTPDDCRDAVGKFGNMFSLMAPGELLACLPFGGFKCELRANVRPESKPKRYSDCYTFMPKTPVDNVSNELADEVLKLMAGHPGIRKLLRWACFLGLEYDEAVQEVMIGMWDALRSFDPRISPLASFMVHCARKKLYTRLGRDRLRRIPSVSFSENLVSLPPSTRVPCDAALRGRSESLALLTSMEMSAVRERASGKSYLEIGSGIAFSNPKSVDNALSRVSHKLGKKGGNAASPN